MFRTATWLNSIVLLLVSGGVIMLASTSALHGERLYKDPNFFITRQVAAIIVGTVAAFLTSRIDYKLWRKLAIPISCVTAVLLMLVLSPVGLEIKGSRRWLDLGPVNLQPSEMAKFAAVLVTAWWMTRVQRRTEGFVQGLLMPGLLFGMMAILVLLEPDFGTTMLISVAGAAVMFIGGTRLGHLAIAGTLAFSALTIMIMEDAERMSRIIAFLDPLEYQRDEAYQLLQSMYGFIEGGWRGVGLGEGVQKHYYLPEAHTDFIFAIIGEEKGFIATAAVVLLFIGFFFCGLRISWRSADMFGRLLAFGITFIISLQAAFNIAVVTGCMPTKGIPLPFISYGGTSMVMMLAMVGILVNIERQPAIESPDADMPEIKNKLKEF